MPGELDRAYVQARSVLLDALEALQDQLDALILVGAQAIYLHTGEADLAVLPYTTDADIAIDPTSLADDPKLGDAMLRAGFAPHETHVGIWVGGGGGVQVDLLVPGTVGGAGRRAARLGVHGKEVALKVRGLEAALVDRAPMVVDAFDETDRRRFEIAVAGPAALLVAKLHKVGERRDQPRRQDDKDAFDVYRILYGFETAELAPRLEILLAEPLSSRVTREALEYLRTLFGTPQSLGSAMAGRNAEGLADPAGIAASVAALAADLIDALVAANTIDDVLDAEAVERLAAAIAEAGLNLRSRVDNLDGAKAAMKGAGEALDRAAVELRAALNRAQSKGRRA